MSRNRYSSKSNTIELYEVAAARNVEAYELLLEFEILTRELIHELLEDAHGLRWAKNGLPPDILEKIERQRIYEIRVRQKRLSLHKPLYYVDFPDLKKIIINGRNWPSIFEQHYTKKSHTEAAFSEIEPIRNAIAHNRFITEDELKILKGCYSRLVRALPEDVIARLKRVAAQETSVEQLLVPLSHTMTLVKMDMNTGAYPECLSPSVNSLKDEWWLDDVYLHTDTAKIKEAIELMQEYASIPRGIGQALVRHEWAIARAAQEVLQAAIAVISKIVGKS